MMIVRIKKRLTIKKKISTFNVRSAMPTLLHNTYAPPAGMAKKAPNLKRTIKLKGYGIITIDKRLNSPLAHRLKG